MNRLVALLLLAGLATTSVGRAEELLTRKLHPWGECSPGAWKMVRVVSKCMGEGGAITGINSTETKTTLQQVDERGVMLRVNSLVEFLGKRMESDGQIIRQGFHGEADEPNLTVKPLAAAKIVVDGREIPCSVAEVDLAAPDSKTVTTLHYSNTLPPYIFKRQSVVTDPEGKQEVSRTTTEVVALDMPCEVLSDLKPAAQVRTVYRHPKGVITSLSFVSPDVPGGVVSSSSKETDADGRLTRISVLKLVGYSFEPEEERGLFGRKKPSRYRTFGLPPTK